MRGRRFIGRTKTRLWFPGFAGAFGLWVALLLATGSAVLAGPPPTGVPSLQTKTSPSVSLGGSISDSAQMIGLPGGSGSIAAPPTGTLTFKLYGPNDATCSMAAVFTSAVPLVQQGGVVSTATSGSYTPPAGSAGTYRWIASYPGDANYMPKSTACGDETVQVTDVTPTITTLASPGVQAGSGGMLTDTATLAGGMAPTGTITFLLFPPTDPTCAGKVVAAKSTIPVSDPNPTVSTPYAPNTPGTYHWIAVYSGDMHNGAVHGACADAGETVVVTPAPAKPATPAGSPPTTPPGTVPGATGPCDPAATAKAVLNGIIATLTGRSDAAFANNCSAGLRIVLRAKEIRPGNRGAPRRDGFTTMANVLTHIAPRGPALAFSLNPAGQALRQYALGHRRSLTAFLIVHVRPDKTPSATESLQILTLG